MTIKCPKCDNVQHFNPRARRLDAEQCRKCGAYYFDQAQKVRGAEQETTTYPYEFERIFQPKS